MGWDRNAPEFGDLAVGDGFQKHSYPFGIMVNARGERFVDEGADFRNYTYAKYGRAILEQPGQFAWQVFDAKVTPSAARRVPHPPGHQGRAPTRWRSWPRKLEDVDAAGFLATLQAFNAAVTPDVAVQSQRQGRPRHRRASRCRSRNWANPIDTPPFEAYAVTCGITFTFGGLRIDAEARVIDSDGAPIRGPLRGRRAGRRSLLLQLPRRHGPDGRRGVRQDRRGERGGPHCAA